MQRTLADTLDVDPNEIAIADIRRVLLDDNRKTALDSSANYSLILKHTAVKSSQIPPTVVSLPPCI